MSDAGVSEPHVEEGGEDEGEQGDRGGPDQVQDRAEAWDRLGDEQEAEDGEGPEGATLPVEIWEIKSFDSCNDKARISLLDGTLSISSKN